MDNHLIFGLHPVIEALEGETELTKIYISQTGDFKRLAPVERQAAARNISVTKVPNVKLDKLANGANHQGVIARISPVKYWDLTVLLAKTLREDKPLLLYLDGVTDTRNLGGIARSAACMGINGIILPIQGSAAVTEDTVKTSAGAILNIPVCRIDNSKLGLHTAMAEGFELIAVTEKGNVPMGDVKYNGPTILMFGGEQKGISPGLIKLAQQHAHIPMKGGVDSLNVSVATGIACYELSKLRF
ncbi:23S rRNA (guanosine(2251)-2'-O)-methyltransferase RlmB [Luteibaculum oceani]|uniref:23S rRNA (Guanosine(2251)-2'-O)-methyltransferase RlmB n=1 Tax=Luteibaculum oceani TaxID=1294296 RepID=A0A5C6V1U3_9FLAO|nr:23S rRNA (guanosine(2251)-2'-O)-methyltransferase RlmB [Luteibaculum oceani]TXC78376.1 23S rRNA (guanosine(2251)-2'-O)-methyltransferase RlmB [Luteibaculum oceani]